MKTRAELEHALDVMDALMDRYDIGTRQGKEDFDREWGRAKAKLKVTDEDMNDFLGTPGGPDLPDQRPIDLDKFFAS